MSSQSQAVAQLVGEVEETLKTLSTPAPGLTSRGNSDRLVRKLGRVRRVSSPSAKAKALVATLDEIVDLTPMLNDHVAEYLAQRSISNSRAAIEIITNLENALRACVRNRLSQTTSEWWAERVPKDVRSRAERYRERAQVVYPSVAAPEDPLSYVSFADYDDIILSDRNWEECFAPVFGNRAWTSTKLGDLEPIQNALMHSRDLTQHGIEKLRVTSRDILERIKKF